LYLLFSWLFLYVPSSVPAEFVNCMWLMRSRGIHVYI
jgi:hypothetical protein